MKIKTCFMILLCFVFVLYGFLKDKGFQTMEFYDHAFKQFMDIYVVTASGSEQKTTPPPSTMLVIPFVQINNHVITTKKLFNNLVRARLSTRNLFDRIYADSRIRRADEDLYATVHEQPDKNVLFKISVAIS